MFAFLALSASAQDLVLEGLVPADDGVDYFVLDVEVPVGTVEIEVAHRATDDRDVLDFGLLDVAGFRGWGGGNSEPAVVGEEAASRSYLPGPLPAGTWRVLVGEAQLRSEAPGYRVEVSFHTKPTLAQAADRAPYTDAAPLVNAPGWYAGDFHVHSEDSGDASATLDTIGAFAEGRGLDFVVVTDHNTVSHLDRLGAVQAAHPALLYVPGVEFTTYAGHATGFGASSHVPHTLGYDGVTVEAAAEAFAAQDALFSINHPVLDLGDLCIGCAWTAAIPPVGLLHGVEVQTGAYGVTGALFHADAVAFWEGLLDQGHHLAALGGSDDHRGGTGEGPLDSPIGSPTTLVWADDLSVDALREGVRSSRTVVKLNGPEDPMIILDTTPARDGDTVTAATVTLDATVTGGLGSAIRFVRNGVAMERARVDADPFVLSLDVSPPASGSDRYRVEALGDDDVPQVLTSYVWVAAAPEAEEPLACGCRSGGGSAALVVCAALFSRRRRLPVARRADAHDPRAVREDHAKLRAGVRHQP
jgi:hypothetical protein